MKYSTSFIFAMALHIPALASSNTFQECINVANSDNKSYPSQTDEIVTLVNEVCFEEGNRVVLAYRYLLDIDSKGIPKAKQNEVFQSVKKRIQETVISRGCSNKMFRSMLNHIDTRYEYFTTGKLEKFTTFMVTKKDCN